MSGSNGVGSGTPPTPDGVPLLGNGLAFSRDPIGAIEEWSKLGDVVRLRVPGQTMYLVTGPEAIKQVLIDPEDAFTIAQAQQETFSGIEDHAVTTSTGERWDRLRTAMRPAFTQDAMERYADQIVTTTIDHLDRWDDGDQIDLYREMRLLAVNVLADALLDVDLRGQEQVVMNAADGLVDRANFRRPGQLLPDWVPTPTDRRFKRAVTELDTVVAELLAAKAATDRGDDLCSCLLSAHEAGDLSMDEVRHNIVAMLLAGHDSPSVTLTHLFRLLSANPDVAAAVRDEASAIGTHDRPSGDTVGEYEYATNVVRETLRLFPPTLGVTRQATKAVTLAGYELPAGGQVLCPQWPVHRDDRFWTAPSSFDPSRWTETRDRPDFAYFPFSGGPRTCIGDQFARLELTLIVVTILTAVELDVTVDGSLSFTPSLQLRP